jgi:hypothetical protein
MLCACTGDGGESASQRFCDAVADFTAAHAAAPVDEAEVERLRRALWEAMPAALRDDLTEERFFVSASQHLMYDADVEAAFAEFDTYTRTVCG